MKFEAKLEILIESIIDSLGQSAKNHDKILEIKPKASQQERIEIMLEVVSEVLEKQGSLEESKVSKELNQLRADFRDLKERLENVKITVPQLEETERLNRQVLEDLSEVSRAISQLEFANNIELEFDRKEKFKWPFFISIATTVIFIIVIILNWNNYFEYKGSDQKWRFLYIQDSTGVLDELNDVWEVDSLRNPRIDWLNEQQRVLDLQEEKQRIDKELENYKN